MFSEGFLAEIYQENPVCPGGIEKVKTRFPPEPNGHLHIGHAKAMAINFGFARYYGGDCYLRLDDTNPDTGEDVYHRSIEESVSWLGFQPIKITYSSDYFDRLYELAEFLIGEDGAYVCHCSKSEIELSRGEKTGRTRVACAHRDRPITESLAEFRAMRHGKYQQHEASLRLKQNLEDGNPQMWDLTAYRIRDKPHWRTGMKWRIYPTYGRLNLSGVVTSKRKIADLVSNKHVRGWDDPRLYTLIGLRRRGVPPDAILAFVYGLGVTKAVVQIAVNRFEQTVRDSLESSVPRLMMVVDPILVVIDNLPDDHLEMLEVPFSRDPSFGVHTVPFTKFVYIDRSDFREIDSKDYFRLAPGKSVGLMKVPYPITATSTERDPVTGLVTSVHATYDMPAIGGLFKKPKTYIQWVARSSTLNSPISAEVRMYNSLFSSETQSVINPNSEEVFPNAMLETGFQEIQQRAPWPADSKLEKPVGEGRASAPGVQNDVSPSFRPETVRFQGMRVAYFCVDRDSTENKLVLNRIVGLKGDARKI